MWTFTKDGFFSAVEHRNDSMQLMVRARSQDDIRRLAGRLRTKWQESEPFADYPFRLVCPKSVWGQYLASAASQIDYDNFKDAMSEKFDAERLSQLHEVWWVMRTSPFDQSGFREPIPKE